MSKRSMGETAPEKIKKIDDTNPENKDPQSVEDLDYLISAVDHNKGGAKKERTSST